MLYMVHHYMFYMAHRASSEVVASLGLFGEVVVQLAFDISCFITFMVHNTNKYASELSIYQVKSPTGT